MQKVNVSPINCIHTDCVVIPTLVLEFVHRSGRKVLGQIITCSEHRQEGIKLGNSMFGGSFLQERRYPTWLLEIQEGVLRDGKAEGKTIAPVDIERLRSFMGSTRRPAELR